MNRQMGSHIPSAETKRPDAAKHRALVVVAAGEGQRLGHGVPKAMVELAGRPMLAHTLDRLSREAVLELVVLVLPSAEPARGRLAALGADFARVTGVDVVVRDGGSTRSGSVRHGVDAVVAHAEHHGWAPERTTTLIHDAARPLTPVEVHQRVAQQVEAGAAAVIPAVSVSDTIKETRPAPDGAVTTDSAEFVVETLPRARLRAAQTPQGFTLDLLQRLFSHLGQISDAESAALTDEAMVAESLGVGVHVVPGDPRALKITTAIDLMTAESLVDDAPVEGSRGEAPRSSPRPEGQPPAGQPRVGIGHDIHAFADDSSPRQLWLAGLHWPGQQGLSGHSDGDVVAHAACDALFSAAGIGDMGAHFGADTLGTDSPELEGASGVRLLEEAASLVRGAGFEISSIAVQFIGNRPKFGPRREEAQRVLSAAADAPVALSATTSDGLGFTGRGEGLMATATAVLMAQGPATHLR